MFEELQTTLPWWYWLIASLCVGGGFGFIGLGTKFGSDKQPNGPWYVWGPLVIIMLSGIGMCIYSLFIDGWMALYHSTLAAIGSIFILIIIVLTATFVEDRINRAPLGPPNP